MTDYRVKAFVILSVLGSAVPGWATESACPKIETPQFSAGFELKNDPAGNGAPMSIQIGKDVAVIWSQGVCQAVCAVKASKTIPEAIDLNCRSKSIASLSSPASVVWENGAPTLRFGSWLQGYEQADLLKPSEPKREVAQAPSMNSTSINVGNLGAIHGFGR